MIMIIMIITTMMMMMIPIIISGQSNLTTGRIAAADGQFNGIRQVALVCIPTL